MFFSYSNWKVALASVIIFWNCSSVSKDRAMEHADSGRCEDSLGILQDAEKFDKAKQITKSTISKPLTFLTASGVALLETIVYVGGGTAVGALVCAPVAALEAALDSKSNEGIRCFIEVGGRAIGAMVKEGNYQFTRGFWENTKSVRMESYDELSSALRKSTDCFIKRNHARDKEIARKQILNVKNKRGIWEYISDVEKSEWRILESRM
ncbi:MAG: hypothetical protein IT569_09650 [Leptospiraceae bacterium]|nr:hypothetical protein [Leptospiraceae bacterium]